MTILASFQVALGEKKKIFYSLHQAISYRNKVNRGVLGVMLVTIPNPGGRYYDLFVPIHPTGEIVSDSHKRYFQVKRIQEIIGTKNGDIK